MAAAINGAVRQNQAIQFQIKISASHNSAATDHLHLLSHPILFIDRSGSPSYPSNANDADADTNTIDPDADSDADGSDAEVEGSPSDFILTQRLQLDNIKPIGTTDQTADIFTKPLPERQFVFLRKKLCGW